jgi:hypothetical protein
MKSISYRRKLAIYKAQHSGMTPTENRIFKIYAVAMTLAIIGVVINSIL